MTIAPDMLKTRHPKKYFVAGVYQLLNDTGMSQKDLAAKVKKEARSLNTWMRNPDSAELRMEKQLEICDQFKMEYIEIMDYGRSIIEPEFVPHKPDTELLPENDSDMKLLLSAIQNQLSMLTSQVIECRKDVELLKKVQRVPVKA